MIDDPIGQFWPNEQGTANSGALVIFAYESGTLEDDGTRVLENVIVNSRVWTPKTFYQPDPDNEGEFLEVNGTYGQTLPGVPWYNLADPSAVGEDGNFTFQILSGAGTDDDYQVQRRYSQCIGSPDVDHARDSAVHGQRRALSRR